MIVHFGTGKQVDRSEIPPWKGKPSGTKPIERTACGSYVLLERVVHAQKGVTCVACKRTHLYQDAR